MHQRCPPQLQELLAELLRGFLAVWPTLDFRDCSPGQVFSQLAFSADRIFLSTVVRHPGGTVSKSRVGKERLIGVFLALLVAWILEIRHGSQHCLTVQRYVVESSGTSSSLAAPHQFVNLLPNFPPSSCIPALSESLRACFAGLLPAAKPSGWRKSSYHRCDAPVLRGYQGLRYKPSVFQSFTRPDHVLI